MHPSAAGRSPIDEVSRTGIGVLRALGEAKQADIEIEKKKKG